MEKNSEELTSRLSYEVVKEVAPDELDLFDDFKEEFLKNPDAFLEKDPQKREKMLGFAIPGVGEKIIIGVVLSVVSAVIEKWVSKKVEEKLGSNEIKELRDYAYNNAVTLGMDKEKAEIMADSIMGKLSDIGFQ